MSQKNVKFHFVTGNPQTEVEKRTVRTIVRSNASNRRWKQVRETAARSSSPKPAGDTPSQSQSPEPEAEHKLLKRQRLAYKNVRRQAKALPTDVSPMSPVQIVNIAQHYLGTMPSSDVSIQSINRVLQGTAASYAQIFPSSKNSLVSQMAKDWFQQCLSTRGILHTALFCEARRAQAVHQRLITMSSNELMLCHTEAVHAINAKLLQESTATDDESLRIVFSLTWHGPVQQGAPPRTPRQTPLAGLQSLRLFLGIIASDPVHARGLERMLSLRGGLETVEMPGLAFLISYGDITGASSELRRPKWSYGSYAQHNPDAVVGDEWLRATRRADHALASLGHAFSALRLWIIYERASQLQLVLDGMADYIRASDDFIRQLPAERNNAVMSDQRNMIQHRLMSLCLPPEDAFEGRDLFDVTWLAAVAYSLIAVFPLAPNAARFDRLAHLIRQKMSDPMLGPYWSRAPDLLLWIMVVGALCAVGTRHRSWYVNALKQEQNRLGMLTWTNLRFRLTGFLWFPFTSDLDGLELWEEIQQSGYVIPWESPTPPDDSLSLNAFPMRSRSGSAATPSSIVNENR